MFEPECQNVDCPQCVVGKIYFDRDIGYYCMSCGHNFSVVDMKILIENKTKTSGPAQKSESDRKKPPLEIKELPARKTKAKPISPDVTEHKKPKQ